jgi:hypothetical protein
MSGQIWYTPDSDSVLLTETEAVIQFLSIDKNWITPDVHCHLPEKSQSSTDGNYGAPTSVPLSLGHALYIFFKYRVILSDNYNSSFEYGGSIAPRQTLKVCTLLQADSPQKGSNTKQCVVSFSVAHCFIHSYVFLPSTLTQT